jgi:dihydrodipicolinate synthase/N-acetylneuraminate lyase
MLLHQASAKQGNHKTYLHTTKYYNKTEKGKTAAHAPYVSVQVCLPFIVYVYDSQVNLFEYQLPYVVLSLIGRELPVCN